jgi:hypothetical protein
MYADDLKERKDRRFVRIRPDEEYHVKLYIPCTLFQSITELNLLSVIPKEHIKEIEFYSSIRDNTIDFIAGLDKCLTTLYSLDNLRTIGRSITLDICGTVPTIAQYHNINVPISGVFFY